jgi:hypothetical protein
MRTPFWHMFIGTWARNRALELILDFCDGDSLTREVDGAERGRRSEQSPKMFGKFTTALTLVAVHEVDFDHQVREAPLFSSCRFRWSRFAASLSSG